MFNLKKKFLIIFFFLFSLTAHSSDYINQNALKNDLNCKMASFENLQYLNPTSEIHIRIPKSSKWNQNLFAAFLENKIYIIEKYKKKFNAQIILKNNILKNECVIPAKVRLNGDILDHIDIINKKNQPKASLDVKLEKGNLKNIISFKLFIPKTKYDENFIIFQSIMSELNFITPRSKYVDVKVNDNDLEKYLFVEKPSKEMIEFNYKKEGPIIAIDESHFWKKDQRREEAYTPKLVNDNWASQNNLNLQMSKEILDIISLVYLEYHQRFHIENKDHVLDLNFNILEEAGYDVGEIKRYNLALIAFNAIHGLQPNNRKFFFSPLTKKNIPNI